MSKKILLTGTELHLHQFWIPHIENFINNGYSVDIICSNVSNRLDVLKSKLEGLPVSVEVIDLSRSPFKLSNITGYKQLNRILIKRHYDIIITNEPVMGTVTRLSAKKYRKSGTKVLYISHGFHFYTGAPKINWILFYPVEKWLSKYTDTLVTINQEDFSRAKKKFKSNHTHYIHGMGVNTNKLQKSENPKNIRSELNMKDNDFIVISIGELNNNKNHKVVLQALGQLKDSSIQYIICGKGDQLDNLKNLAIDFEISNNVHFLGYRNDIADICNQADLFVFPSYREGLGLAPLEAMYCGLPVITSKIRGPVDFMQPGENGEICPPNDYNMFAESIKKIKEDKNLCMKYGEAGCKIVEPYCIEFVKNELLEIIKNM